jgi:hypothetical protein
MNIVYTMHGMILCSVIAKAKQFRNDDERIGAKSLIP